MGEHRWFTPGFIKQLGKERYTPDDVSLFLYCDFTDGTEYIPAFRTFDQCQEYVWELSGGQIDRNICIRGFPTLEDLELRVIEEFGEYRTLLLLGNKEEYAEEDKEE